MGQLMGAKRLGLQPQRLGFQLGQVQQVIEEPERSLTQIMNDAEPLQLFSVEFGRPHGLGDADPPVERDAHLMAHVGQKAHPRVGWGRRRMRWLAASASRQP